MVNPTRLSDLAASPPAHLSGELLSALRPLPGTTQQPGTAIAAELRLTQTLIDEVLQAVKDLKRPA